MRDTAFQESCKHDNQNEVGLGGRKENSFCFHILGAVVEGVGQAKEQYSSLERSSPRIRVQSGTNQRGFHKTLSWRKQTLTFFIFGEAAFSSPATSPVHQQLFTAAPTLPADGERFGHCPWLLGRFTQPALLFFPCKGKSLKMQDIPSTALQNRRVLLWAVPSVDPVTWSHSSETFRLRLRCLKQINADVCRNGSC